MISSIYLYLALTLIYFDFEFNSICFLLIILNKIFKKQFSMTVEEFCFLTVKSNSIKVWDEKLKRLSKEKIASTITDD